MRFKVGDLVKFREDLVCFEEYDSITFYNYMRRDTGYVIYGCYWNDSYVSGGYYQIKGIGGCHWYVSDPMLEYLYDASTFKRFLGEL